MPSRPATPAPSRSRATCRLLAPLTVCLGLSGVAGCRASADAFGATPPAARAAAADLTTGFARRFTNVERDSRFELARNRMGRFALAPSQLFGDTLIWTSRPDPRTRELVVQGEGSATRFRFTPNGDAPEPVTLGDQRHRFELTRLPNDDWRWRTRVEHQVGRFPIDRIGPLLAASLTAASRGSAAVRGDLGSAFPRSSAAFGRLVRFDTAMVAGTPDGARRVVLRSHIDPARLATTMPAFARYVRKYIDPLRYSFVVSTRDNTPVFEVRAWQDTITVTARVHQGRLIPLEGAPRPLGDTLRVAVVASTRFGLFTVGVKQMDGTLYVVRTPAAQLWQFRWTTPPDWRLPFGTTTLLHGSLRRPFEGEGMLVQLGFRRGEQGQTLSVRDVDIAVRESWIVRWVGRLGGSAFSEFVEQAEVEENRYLAEGMKALGADLSALLGAD